MWIPFRSAMLDSALLAQSTLGRQGKGRPACALPTDSPWRCVLARPVVPPCRQDEQHLGVLSESVHLVQELVEESLFERAVHMSVFASNEIRVLDDHDGRPGAENAPA